MSQYTFTFKKDDITVGFTTSDKTAVAKQFQIWVNAASEYAQVHPAKASKIVVPQVRAEEKKIVSEKAAESFVENKQEQTLIAEEPKEVVFEQASSLLKTINTIQNQAVEEIKVEEKPAETADFDAVLEKSIENPTFEPSKVKDQVFLNLINSKNTMDKFHYLMITAYYLSEFEKMERFSIKQINAKLMNNLSEVIDHTMLQEAINQGFIELIPDLTGTSDIGEYRLTPVGEDFFANKI